MAKRKRARRYRSITFKFTAHQKRRVDAYCRKNNTTPIRMYKKAIMLYLVNNGYGSNMPVMEDYPSNQLTIFDVIEETANQEQLQ